MFDIGWSEILLVLVVALVVVGPKDLPRLMRIVGKWVGKARHVADQFRASFDELARETELDELRREIVALRGNNPLTRFQDEINRSIQPPDAAGAVPARMAGEPAGEPAPEAPHDALEHPTLAGAISPASELPPPAAEHAAAVEPGLEPLPPGFTPTGP